MFIHKCETNLDDLEQVHITAQQLVLVISRTSEFSDRPGNYPRKFCILNMENFQLCLDFVLSTYTFRIFRSLKICRSPTTNYLQMTKYMMFNSLPHDKTIDWSNFNC